MAGTRKGLAKTGKMMNDLAKQTKSEIVKTATRNAPIMRTEEIENDILTRLSVGESLIEICNDAGMPNRSVVNRWMLTDINFKAKVAQAREYAAEYYAEALIDVARGGVLSTNNIERDKLLSSNIKWIASKFNRSMFGDQIDVKHSTETIHINLPSEFGDDISI